MVPFRQTQFLTSAAKFSQCPDDMGTEIAMAGRSNAGKSTLINLLCDQKHLAKTSKQPGRTQLINFFSLSPKWRIVDLPGYGFAKVPGAIRANWHKEINAYFQKRASLKLMVVIMDIRHPLKETDMQMLEFAREVDLAAHVVLSKADKLSKAQMLKSQNKVKSALAGFDQTSIQCFSALSKLGLDKLKTRLSQVYQDDA